MTDDVVSENLSGSSQFALNAAVATSGVLMVETRLGSVFRAETIDGGYEKVILL